MASSRAEELEKILQRSIDLYQQARVSDAIHLLREKSKLYPGSGKLWGYLGFLNKSQRRLPAAIRCFTRAVMIAPHSEKASLGLFHSLWRAGHSEKAFDE